MKNNNKVTLTESKGKSKKELIKSAKKSKQEVANPSFPQEYEEQLDPNIHMKPQLFVTNKKSKN